MAVDQILIKQMLTKCPRYIVAKHDESGLGHRIGVVADVVNLAMEFDFTPVLSEHQKEGKPRFQATFWD